MFYLRKWKRFLYDIVINIISVVMPIMLLQMIILPSIGNKLGSREYGYVIAMISLITLSAEPFGFALNNSRLLSDSLYKEKHLEGDYNLLIVYTLPINALIILIYNYYYFGNKINFSIIMLLMISTALLLQIYFGVYFRLNLTYIKVFFNGLLKCLGYVVGLCLFIYFDYSWMYIYLLGSVFSLLYTCWDNKLLGERIKKTKLFLRTFRECLILFFVELMNSITKYADRLILLPLLGGEAVTIYYSATIVSKLILLVISPISSVILSYFSKIKTFNLRHFFSMLVIGTGIGTIGYGICIVIAPFLLHVIYPEWALDSIPLMYITTGGAVIDSINNLVRPALLRFRSKKWQLILGGVNCISYISIVYIFYLYDGLHGFCWGILFNSLLQLILKIIIFIIAKERIY